MYQQIVELIQTQMGEDKEIKIEKVMPMEGGGTIYFMCDGVTHTQAYTEDSEGIELDGEAVTSKSEDENEKGKKTETKADETKAPESQAKDEKGMEDKSKDSAKTEGENEMLSLIKECKEMLSKLKPSEKSKDPEMEDKKTDKKENTKSFEAETPEQRVERLSNMVQIEHR